MADEIHIVKHVAKTRANLPATMEDDTIYFVTDEYKIYKGSKKYSGVGSVTKPSNTNGQISVDGSTITVYSHPLAPSSAGTDGVDPAAVKVGRDQYGHVVLGNALTASDVGAVPTSRTVNGQALSSDVSLKASDVGALAASAKDTTAPNANSTDATVPTSKAVWAAIANGIAVADALVYKGTIAGGSTGSYGALTQAADKGHVYKVSTAGKIDGKPVEVGDMLICNTDGTAAATSSNYSTIGSNWDVIQNNVDGALFKDGNAFTDGHVLAADGASGKVKDTGIAASSLITSHQTIKQDGLSGPTINRYGECSTAAATAAKTVSITSGIIPPTLGTSDKGLKVTVKFANANTANSPTLNVSSTGAKNIFHKGSQITSGANKALLAGVCDFVFDGTQWNFVGNYVGEIQDILLDTTNKRLYNSGGSSEYAQFSSPSVGVVRVSDAHSTSFDTTIIQNAQPKTTQNPSGRAGYLLADDMTRFELMWDALLWG